MTEDLRVCLDPSALDRAPREAVLVSAGFAAVGGTPFFVGAATAFFSSSYRLRSSSASSSLLCRSSSAFYIWISSF